MHHIKAHFIFKKRFQFPVLKKKTQKNKKKKAVLDTTGTVM